MTRKELQNAIKSHLGRCFVRPFNEFNNLPELQALPRIQFSIKWMEMEEGANSNQKNGLHFCMPLAIAAQLNLPFDHATKDSVSADFVLPNTKFMRLIVLVSVLLVLHAPIYCHCHHIGIHFVSFFFSSSSTLFDVAFFESVCYIDLESLHFHDRAHYIHTNSCWLLVWKFASRMHYSFMKTYYSIDKKPETQIARIPGEPCQKVEKGQSKSFENSSI